jgi:hypothetical protein
MKNDYGKYIVLIVLVVALFGLLGVVESGDLVGQGYIKMAQKMYTPGAGNIVDDADPGGPTKVMDPAEVDDRASINKVLPGELAYKEGLYGGAGGGRNSLDDDIVGAISSDDDINMHLRQVGGSYAGRDSLDNHVPGAEREVFGKGTIYFIK